MKAIKSTVIILSVLAMLFMAAAPSFALSAGAKAPDFTLSDLNDEEVALKDFKGKVVVLNFWATWCPPCRAEMPEFNELNAEFKESKKAVLLAINLTDGARENKQKVSKFMQSNGYDMRVLLDNGGETAKKYAVMGIPTTVVIDEGGKVSEIIVGAATKDAVMKAVRKAAK
jgi:peroxiredoxin